MSPEDIVAYDVTGLGTAEDVMGWLRRDIGDVCLTEKIDAYYSERSDEFNYIGLNPEESLRFLELISGRIHQLEKQVREQFRSSARVYLDL